ncbi:hypothetical protein [Rhodovibrio sodomensis]|uniref:hypothetical protein n=1 Tax=Rhodovibrio sodomensis TaxID=1088 RepID=UPI0019082BD0|nr:hypothetical protein [Rhodovibrio sodomensis]
MDAHIRIFQLFLAAAGIVGVMWIAKNGYTDSVVAGLLGFTALVLIVRIYRAIKSRFS